jgi:hypothetical protein
MRRDPLKHVKALLHSVAMLTGASRGIRLFALLLVCLVLAHSAADGKDARVDEAAWQLRHEDDATGTRVWLRHRKGELPAFRATTTIEARLVALAAVLLDPTRTHEWVYRTREAMLLKSDGPLRGVSLVVTAMPWPLLDREAVVVWAMAQDPQTLAITLVGHGDAGWLPLRHDRVRMPAFESRWQLTPRADGRVDVLFEGHGDPGGNLAHSPLREFLASSLWEGPLHTLVGFREIVQRPVYSLAELPFLREPSR